MQDASLHYNVQAFFMSATVLVQPYIGVRIPPCTGLMAVQHLVVNVLSSGSDSDTFFIYTYVTVSRLFQFCTA